MQAFANGRETFALIFDTNTRENKNIVMSARRVRMQNDNFWTFEDHMVLLHLNQASVLSILYQAFIWENNK